MMVRFLLSLLVIGFQASLVTGQSPTFEFQNGDRVVLVGDGLIEFDQRYGHLEAALTMYAADRMVTFRNVGWSGDTPTGTSRDHITNPPTGYEHLIEQITQARPTVVFFGYGSHLAFEDADAIQTFIEDLKQLLDDLASTHARFVLVSPIPHEQAASPHPDVGAFNTNLKQVGTALKALAEERSLFFVDLLDPVVTAYSDHDGTLTSNGIHLNEEGYRVMSRHLVQGLQGHAGPGTTDSETYRRLRTLVVQKNALYFRSYRPQNETYLVGFRAYEQGQNADELNQFEPLIDEIENEIGRLRSTWQ